MDAVGYGFSRFRTEAADALLSEIKFSVIKGNFSEIAALCGEGEVLRCLLVRRRGGDGGVLVLPERGAFVGWAALEN